MCDSLRVWFSVHFFCFPFFSETNSITLCYYEFLWFSTKYSNHPKIFVIVVSKSNHHLFCVSCLCNNKSSKQVNACAIIAAFIRFQKRSRTTRSYRFSIEWWRHYIKNEIHPVSSPMQWPPIYVVHGLLLPDIQNAFIIYVHEKKKGISIISICHTHSKYFRVFLRMFSSNCRLIITSFTKSNNILITNPTIITQSLRC